MTIVAFLFRIRLIVLTVAGLAMTAAVGVAMNRYALPVGVVFLAIGTLIVAAIGSFLVLRHALLSAIVAISPVAGMIAAGPFALDAGATLPEFLAAYGLGLCVAVNLAEEIVRGILAGDEAVSAARMSLSRALVPVFIAVVGGVSLFLVWFAAAVPTLAIGSALVLTGSMLSALAIAPFAASYLRYGEQFVVDANRARAFTEGLFRVAAMVAIPRWAMSVCGIAIVFAVLGWFGSGGGPVRYAALVQPLLWAASAALFFLLVLAVRRNWRHALAVTLTLIPLVLTGVWLWDLAGARLTASFLQTLLIAATAFLFLSQLLFGVAASRLEQGDAAGIVRARAIEEGGPGIGMSAVVAAVAILPWMVIHGTIALLALEFLIAGASSVLVAPAAETALEALLPRRSSVKELYGRR